MQKALMFSRFDEFLIRQFTKIADAIHYRTGITNFGISKAFLCMGLGICASEPFIDFRFGTVDFETYFHFVYVLIVGATLPPVLNSVHRYLEKYPSAPNRFSLCVSFLRKASAFLFLFMVLRLIFNFHFAAAPLFEIPGTAHRAWKQMVLYRLEISSTFLFLYFASVKPSGESEIPEEQ